MYQLVDCFFFISLGITFLLLFLMAFHFKTRISSLEKKNDALADMCTTIVSKISQVKQMVVEQKTITPNIFFRSAPNTTSNIIEIEESESESESESEDEQEQEQEQHVELLEDALEIVELNVEEPVELNVEEPVLEEEEVKIPEADLQSEVFSMAINQDDKNSFKKMSVQMLRTLVISKGISTDPSKMKKPELLKMLSDSEIDIS